MVAFGLSHTRGVCEASRLQLGDAVLRGGFSNWEKSKMEALETSAGVKKQESGVGLSTPTNTRSGPWMRWFWLLAASPWSASLPPTIFELANSITTWTKRSTPSLVCLSPTRYAIFPFGIRCNTRTATTRNIRHSPSCTGRLGSTSLRD